MKMDPYLIADEELGEVRLAIAPPRPRRRDWGAPVLVVAALLAAGAAVAQRPAMPVQSLAHQLS